MHNDVVEDQDAQSVNARSVLRALLVGGPSSRAELSRRLSFSAATLTKVTRSLIESGHCFELEVEAPSTGGRRPQLLDVNVDFAHFVGVKLTDATVFSVVTDARGRVLAEADEPLNAADPQQVAEQIAARVKAFRADDDRITAVGIALSGTASRSSPSVRTSPFLHWNDVPLATMVSALTCLPTVLENDVRAVTAAEHWFGAATGLDSFAIITLGAGIGCGIVLHGQQVDGHLGASGLIGHLRVGDPALLCYAGHPGCANAYATTGGIAKRLSYTYGRRVEFDEVVELAGKGDPAARAALEGAGLAIGTILATVVNLLGPEKVFVSGEGVAMFDLSRDVALGRMRELLHWTASAVDVESQPFGFTEWARGAAVVAIQSHVEVLNTRPSEIPAPAPVTESTRGAA